MKDCDLFTPSQRAGLRNCRDVEQLLAMTRHYMRGTCPFCGDSAEYDVPWLPISGVHWRVKENLWPMAHTKKHLIIAPIAHITELSQVEAQAWAEMGPILARIKERYGKIHGGLAFRSGSLAYSAGTVEHLHANVLYPDLTGPVRVTLAKEVGGPELERRIRRFEEFSKQLPLVEQRFLFDHGIGLSTLLLNEIHD